MRGDPSRQPSSGEGRNSPNVVQSNGVQQLHTNFTSSTSDSSLHPPGANGISSPSNPHNRTSSSSYSSVLASSPATQSPAVGGDGQGGNNGFVPSANHDKPFKYSRDEMLNIWKSNAARYKNVGIPLEFEKHEAFTSEEPLDPVLLTEMSLAEKEVVPL